MFEKLYVTGQNDETLQGLRHSERGQAGTRPGGCTQQSAGCRAGMA